MRSLNNNMLIFSSYWHTWSRILFHDHGGRGMERMRDSYSIPKHIKSIEVDLTASGNDTPAAWGWVAQVRIRCHCTEIGYNDLLQASLTQTSLERMREHLDDRTINILMHADLLPFIDFDKVRAQPSGGSRMANIIKDFMTLDEYRAMQRKASRKPDLLPRDVETEWKRAGVAWAETVQSVTPQPKA